MGDRGTIFIVDDHELFRDCVKAMMADECEVVGEAPDGTEAIRLIPDLKPDLVLLDISMPRMSGLAALHEIKRLVPDVKVMVLSIHETDEFVLKAFEAGADGYAIKDCSRDELKLAIRTVLRGNKYVNPSIAVNVVQGYINGGTQLKSRSALESITAREVDVLKLLAEGYPNKEIADKLQISPKTVEKHRQNIMGKLNLHNSAGLTAFALEHGLLGLRSNG